MKFEWDEQKAERNVVKHGVSFVEAASVFNDASARTFVDLAHSATEKRWLRLGMSQHCRVLLVVYTERGGAVRIISARQASRKERTGYGGRKN